MSLRQQGLGQFSQKAFEERGHVIGMEVTGGEVNVGPPVELLPQRLLSQAVPRDPEETLDVQICRKTTRPNGSVYWAARHWKRRTRQYFEFLRYTV